MHREVARMFTSVKKRINMFTIAMGASAGGVQALKEFFKHKQQTHGETYVVILHSLRTFESKLAGILEGITPIKCVWISDGMEIRQDTIYVCPPSHEVSISDGRFNLTERSRNEKINHTIDHLFNSIASFAKGKGIGIIMSGTGTDGTAGSHEIEKHGGVVIVQDPETAQFDGMPLTSIRYDHPDYVLAPQEMPDLIDRIVAGNEKAESRKQRVLVYR